MSDHLKRIALAAIAVSPIALAAASAPAAASPTLNFSIVANQFNKPTMEFEYQNGQYVWKQHSINTQFSASANTNNNDVHWYGPLVIQSNSVSGSATFHGTVPSQVKSWSLSGPITFPMNFLNVYKGGFEDYCEKNGKVGSSHVNQNLSLLFTAMQAYGPKVSNYGPAPEEVQEGDAPSGTYAQRAVNMPMAVVCLPKPGREIARPGGLKQETPDFKVKSIALNYGGAAPTKPNPTTECKTAKLSVILHTSKAGVVDVKLHKKVGNAPIQAKNMQLYSKFDGNAHFVASYVEYVQVSQPTLVQAMAEEFNSPLGQTTGWKDVTLHCENANGGYADAPRNDPNDPRYPSKQQPKRVFDGAKDLTRTPGTANPDDRNVQRQPKHLTPLKPSATPATPNRPVQIKTAPVPQRDSRFIGTAVPRVQ